VTSLDAKLLELQDATVRRLGAILDIPADTLTDLAGMSHWAALGQETGGCGIMTGMSDETTTEPAATPDGDPAAPDRCYHHDQTTASDVWTIPHNLGQAPLVTINDASGRYMGGGIIEISDPDVNTKVIRFGAPVAGRAYCMA